MLDIDLVRALYRRMDGGGWRVSGDFLSVKKRAGGPTHLDVKWAAEVIREWAEATRSGEPMRKVVRPVRKDGLRRGTDGE